MKTKDFLARWPAAPVLGGVGLLLLSVWSASCIQRSTVGPTPVGQEVRSPKLSRFVYFEDGAVLFLAVDGRAAQYVKEGGIFPLGIGLANQSKTPLTFNREAFVLETSDGKRYPVVSQEEYSKYYSRSRTDAKLADTFTEALASRFANYRFINWRLFSVTGGTTTTSNEFELGRLFWTRGYLYFPIPEGGIHDKDFTLLVDPREVDETFIVRFSLN